jgi:hypothetical protein
VEEHGREHYAGPPPIAGLLISSGSTRIVVGMSAAAKALYERLESKKEPQALVSDSAR